MPVIKRYANRKLYDTQAKRYVTLGDLAAMIRVGEDISVLDHVSGEDITTQVQAQIIFEQERHTGGGLPNNVLSGIIQASNQTLKQLKSTLWPTDSGAQVDAEIGRRVRILVERGDISAKQASLLLEKLLQVQPVPARTPRELALARALDKRGTPTEFEIGRLAARIEDLTRQLDELNPPSSKRKRTSKA